MAILLTLVALGVITNAVVLAASNTNWPRFTKTCQTCGYRMPPMPYPPAVFDCPECDRLVGLGVDLSQRLSQR